MLVPLAALEIVIIEVYPFVPRESISFCDASLVMDSQNTPSFFRPLNKPITPSGLETTLPCHKRSQIQGFVSSRVLPILPQSETCLPTSPVILLLVIYLFFIIRQSIGRTDKMALRSIKCRRHGADMAPMPRGTRLVSFSVDRDGYVPSTLRPHSEYPPMVKVWMDCRANVVRSR